MYSPNFSAGNEIFCLSLHYNGNNSYLFVNGKEVTKFKAKKSEIKTNQLTLGSISTSANLSSSDIEDSKLYGNVYDFSVDYSTISNDKIHDIHTYLMRKNGNETRHIKWHKTCRFKCRLDASICNNKQRWNDDKCRCECKELIDKGTCDKEFIWNPNNCECECGKSCDIGDYLDYKNCRCRKKN